MGSLATRQRTRSRRRWGRLGAGTVRHDLCLELLDRGPGAQLGERRDAVSSRLSTAALLPARTPLTPTTWRRYKLDSTFVHLPASEVLALLQESLAKLRTQAEALETERDGCVEGMKELKAVLYSKFGSVSLLMPTMVSMETLTWLSCSSVDQPRAGVRLRSAASALQQSQLITSPGERNGRRRTDVLLPQVAMAALWQGPWPRTDWSPDGNASRECVYKNGNG